MTFPPSLIPTAESVTVEKATAFLLRKGWNRRPFANPNLHVFVAPNELAAGLDVALPADSTYADFPARLVEVVTLLADVYEEEVDTILHQMAHWNRDVLKVRLLSAQQTEQLPPLSMASELISKYWGLLAFAAASQVNARRFFTRLPKSGKDFADTCIFGHTYTGSFGITIECPLDLSRQMGTADAPAPRPFERGVTERLATGCAALASSIQQDDPNVLVLGYQEGLNGNMCDILTDISTVTQGRAVTQSIIWAPEVPPPEPHLRTAAAIALDANARRILESASKTLHTVEEPDVYKTIVGRVILLKSEQPPSGRGTQPNVPHTIAIMWEADRQQPMKLLVDISAEEYRVACDAHRDGRRIHVVGKPRRDGRRWRIFDYHSFRVVA